LIEKRNKKMEKKVETADEIGGAKNKKKRKKNK
jgi:hypothetical protein